VENNDKHWVNFYKKKKAPIKQTKFAEAVDSFLIDELKERDLSLYDIGAGNARDTKYLNGCSSLRLVAGFDKNHEGRIKKSVNEIVRTYLPADVIYSRFLLHAISNREITKLVKWSKNYFLAEFRIKGDKPVIYQDHKRNLVDLGWLINVLIKNGFEILRLQEGRGYARYKNEDPLVARVYARKIKK